MGPKTLPTMWHTYMKLVTKYQISAITEKNVTKNVHISSMCIKTNYMKLVTKYQIPVINSCLEKCDEKCAYTNVYLNNIIKKNC